MPRKKAEKDISRKPKAKKKVVAKRKKIGSQKKETEVNIWRPSPKQVALAEMLLNPDDRRPKIDKINELKMSSRTFYKWMKDSRFINYLNSRVDEYTNGELSEVWKALLMQCKRGNIEAIKLFFKLKELDPEIQMKRQLVLKETGNISPEQGVLIVDDIK